jgi:sec-independent protein translocase protein TatC
MMAKTKHTRDDLFEGTTMTFGEHLEELRRCLFRGIVGLVIGCAIGFWIANDVVRFFQSPLERAMERYYLDKAQTDFLADYGEIPLEVRQMILREGLIPERTQIEVGELARTLQLTYPEQFDQLSLSPYWFTRGDFKNPGAAGAIARALAAAGREEEASPARTIWRLLTADQQSTLEKLANKTTLSDRDQARVLEALNSAAGQRELLAAKEFADFAGPGSSTASELQTRVMRFFGRETATEPGVVAKLRAELEQGFTPEKARRLNKLLIAEAFPDSLHAARLNLLSLFTWRPVKVRFQVLNAQEAFMIWMKAGLVTGLVLASPWIFYQIWIFVAAGLYPHEKNYVYLYLPISILLFVGGASLAFLFVFDPVLDFLFLFNKGMNADFDPRIGEWLGFVLILPIGFGVAFQLPLVMLFVNRIGLVSTETYIAQWRVAILTIFIVAMVLTPADPVSMLLMAVPLCGLFVVGILMCKYMPRGRSPFAEAYEP